MALPEETNSSASLPPGLPAVGDVLDGKCRIEAVIGLGGMGVVLRARHLHLDQEVAVKVMLPELARNAEVVERFVREGRAAVRIKSQHVVRVLDVATMASGEPYMIMELLHGHDVAELAARAPLKLTQAIDFVLEACEALAEAHAKGIVHRDLKPSNLFVAEQEDGGTMLKVLDFGISKLTELGDDGMSITKSRSVLGSPLYMSPEQLRASRDVDGRSDVWSLGVILFELVTGRLPFDAKTVAEVGAAVLAGEIPTVDAVKPGLPSGLSAVVRRAMSRDRESRYPTIGALVEALAPFASPAQAETTKRAVARWNARPDGAPRSDRSAPHIGEVDTEVALAPAASGSRTGGVWSTSSIPGSGRRRLWGGAVLIVAVGSAATFIAAGRHRAETAPTASASSAVEVAPATSAPIVAPVASATASAIAADTAPQTPTPNEADASIAATAASNDVVPRGHRPRGGRTNGDKPTTTTTTTTPAPAPSASAAPVVAPPPSAKRSDRFE